MLAARMFVKTWRILTKLRTDPARATNLLRALPEARGPLSGDLGLLRRRGDRESDGPTRAEAERFV